MAQRQAALPTYRTSARVLEGEKGSGIRLAGWTIARTFMIAPPMMIVGVPAKQAFFGATFASGLISLFTMLRIFDVRNTGMAGLKSPEAIRYRRRLARRRASR